MASMSADRVLEQQGIPVVGGSGGPEPTRQADAGRIRLAQRSFVFPDLDAAQGFQADMQAAVGIGTRRTGMFTLFNDAPSMASRYGGHLFRSVYGREVRVYGYQQAIFEMDRDYLFARDPTAGMFVEQYNLVWNGLPQSYIPAIDAYFSQQMTLGLLTSLQAAYQEYWQQGGAFVYLETDGRPDMRLSRGERPIAWTFLPAHSIIDDDNPDTGYFLVQPGTPAAVDPLLDHGVEYLSFYPTEEARTAGRPLRVHGSRLIPVNLDPRAQRWWRTPHVPLNRVYDTLWELRDIIFSRTRAHFQGDPIVVDVDISEDAQRLLNIANQTEEQRTETSQAVEQSVLDYNTGAKTSFAPVMGFKMRRLGAAQLPDPKEDVMMLSSRLAHGSSVYPVKFVLASTKGSSDVSDQDLLILAGNVQNVRNVWGYKHLAKAILMGQVMGVGGLRMQDQFNLPHPKDLDWPLLRPLTPRDAAFTEKTDASIARELQEASLVLPPRLRRKFPEDPRYPTPLWLAARGRDTNGESMDPLPASTVGGGGSSARAPDSELEAWLDGKQPATDEDEDEPKTPPKRPRDDS